MTGITFFALALLLGLSHHVLADPKVVSMSTRRQMRVQPERPTRRRATSPDIPLYNRRALFMYTVDVSVGTPPQSVVLDVDTGSSDLWVFSSDAYALCGMNCIGDSFNLAKSTTYAPSSEPAFNIKYGDGSSVSGNYFNDVLNLGNTTVNNATMAVASGLDDWNIISPSIMGIGFESLEAVAGKGPVYPGITRLMVEQGLINTRAYSLWLDDLDSSTGTLLFGGYDRTKYHGDLAVLPIQADASGTVESMLVQWTSLSIANATTALLLTAPSFSTLALLDSGTSLTYIPAALYNAVFPFFLRSNADDTNERIVDCTQPAHSLDFRFGSALVSVPFSELAIPAYNDNGEPILTGNGHACEFGLYPVADGDAVILGDTFLRSAYVVYDLDAAQIGLAQSNFAGDDAAPDIVEITTGTDPLPAQPAVSLASTSTTTASTSTTARASPSSSPPPGFAVTTSISVVTLSQLQGPTGAPSRTLTAPDLVGGSTPGPADVASSTPTNKNAASGRVEVPVSSGFGYVLLAATGMFALGLLQVVFM